MITKHDVEQGSQEWFELREGKFTGEGTAKLLKFGAIEYSLTQAGQIFSSFWTKRGHLLEQEALELYAQIYHIEIEHTGFVTNSLYPNCGYSPDGFTNILLEVKAFDKIKHLEIVKSNVPRWEEIAQTQFGMLIMQLPEAHTIYYNPKVDPESALKIFEIKADKAIQSNIKEILAGKKPGKEQRDE